MVRVPICHALYRQKRQLKRQHVRPRAHNLVVSKERHFFLHCPSNSLLLLLSLPWRLVKGPLLRCPFYCRCLMWVFSSVSCFSDWLSEGLELTTISLSNQMNSSSMSSETPALRKPELEPSFEFISQAKDARMSLEGSLVAIIDVLANEGVSPARWVILHRTLFSFSFQSLFIVSHPFSFLHSVMELRNGVSKGDFIQVLERSQDYVSCVAPSKPTLSSHDQQQHSIANMLAYLIRAAWESLCYFYSMQYKLAYRKFHRLRRLKVCRPGEIERALQVQVKQAEQVCTCQRKLFLIKAQENRLERAQESPCVAPLGSWWMFCCVNI